MYVYKLVDANGMNLLCWRVTNVELAFRWDSEHEQNEKSQLLLCSIFHT